MSIHFPNITDFSLEVLIDPTELLLERIKKLEPFKTIYVREKPQEPVRSKSAPEHVGNLLKEKKKSSPRRTFTKSMSHAVGKFPRKFHLH